MLLIFSFAFFILVTYVSSFRFFPPGEGRDSQHVLAALNLPVSHTSYPPPRAYDLVKPVIANVSVASMRTALETFTSFKTRHSPTRTGRESQLWLLSQLKEIADGYNGPLVNVFEFKHEAFGQRSIIARIHGSNVTADDSIVIIGAHQDSINEAEPENRSPGADDDGSGIVTILEAFRRLAHAGFAPARTVEFHFYAAEEDGRLGSEDVAKRYHAIGNRVAAMVQYDQTAWVKNGSDEAIGILSTNTDMGLTALQVQLVAEYLDLPAVVFKFTWGDSDHSSWIARGYPASCLSEGLFENMNIDNIHTPNDRIDISPEFSFEHMRCFSQHAVAFAIEVGGGELAGWVV